MRPRGRICSLVTDIFFPLVKRSCSADLELGLLDHSSVCAHLLPLNINKPQRSLFHNPCSREGQNVTSYCTAGRAEGRTQKPISYSLKTRAKCGLYYQGRHGMTLPSPCYSASGTDGGMIRYILAKKWHSSTDTQLHPVCCKDQ